MMTRNQLIDYLSGTNDAKLFSNSAQIKAENIGENVYLRGLIEVSNICKKDCLYCGIRCSNKKIERYELTFEEVCNAIDYAIEQRFGSIVIQGGERSDNSFIELINSCLEYANQQSKGKLGITLSLGEQSEDTYRMWRKYGAHRYLLRIESSSEEIYKKIHPSGYSWEERIAGIERLRKCGFQVGTGVMIGLPFQKIEDLADDLLFFQEMDIDMCGMGPYIEHADTPLFQFKSDFSITKRVELTLRMIALLRIVMPKINIAATTALQTLDNEGFEKGLSVGANIMMPNVTPMAARVNYNLYQNKPYSTIDLTKFNVAYDQWGDSKHFAAKQK